MYLSDFIFYFTIFDTLGIKFWYEELLYFSKWLAKDSNTTNWLSHFPADEVGFKFKPTAYKTPFQCMHQFPMFFFPVSSIAKIKYKNLIKLIFVSGSTISDLFMLKGC